MQVGARRARDRYKAQYGMSSVAVWRMRYVEKYGHQPPGYVDWRSDWLPRRDRLAVYERDGFVCQICGDEVDRAAHPNSNMAASLDHVVPRKHGGTDDLTNLQTAHRICNTRKSDSLAFA